MSRSVGRLAAGFARFVTAPLHPWRKAGARAYASQLLLPHWTIATRYGPLTFEGPSIRALHDPHGFNVDEPETVAWIDAMPTDAVLWDIGANVGLYAIYAGKRGVRVLAFEPAASTLAVLTRNIELNAVSDRVAAYGVALSDRTGLDALYMAAGRTEAGHATHSFGTRRTVEGEIEGGFQQATIGYTADDFAASFNAPTPTHVKLDVDGIETAILKGAAGLLRTQVRELMVEVHDQLNPAQAKEIRAALAEAGFVEKPTAHPKGRNKLFAAQRG